MVTNEPVFRAVRDQKPWPGLRSNGTVVAYGIWGESGPPGVPNVAALSASNADVFLHRAGTISVYRDTFPPSAPTGEGFQAVSAGYDYRLAIAAAAAAPSAPILGSADVQPSVDSNPSGTAEAFQYTATRSGPATAVHVYLDEQHEATQVIVFPRRRANALAPYALPKYACGLTIPLIGRSLPVVKGQLQPCPQRGLGTGRVPRRAHRAPHLIARDHPHRHPTRTQ